MKAGEGQWLPLSSAHIHSDISSFASKLANPLLTFILNYTSDSQNNIKDLIQGVIHENNLGVDRGKWSELGSAGGSGEMFKDRSPAGVLEPPFENLWAF